MNNVPDMLTIPAGRFIMGTAGEDRFANSTERPAHEVVIEKPFAVARFPITESQWAAFAGDEDSSLPVVRVNWWDAKRYTECPAIYGCGTQNESRAGAEAFAGFNPEKAKAMLKAAGYGGQPIVLLDPTDNAVLHPAALVGTQTLKRMGINVDVQAMDFSTLTQRRASKNPPAQGGWNVFMTNATMTGIANPLLNTFSGNCEQGWYGWPCDRRIVDLSRQWALELDAGKRKQIIGELQKVHLENVTYIPLGQYRSVIAYRKNLQGMIAAPPLFYWNVEKN